MRYSVDESSYSRVNGNSVERRCGESGGMGGSSWRWFFEGQKRSNTLGISSREGDVDVRWVPSAAAAGNLGEGVYGTPERGSGDLVLGRY